MKSKPASDRPLHYTQTPDELQAWAQPTSRTAGIVTGLLLLGFIGMFVKKALDDPDGSRLLSAFSAVFFSLLFFGFIPVVLLRRQRITLNRAGLESRFFVFAFPVWRNFIPMDSIKRFDSVWDGGSDEGACMRLLIRDESGETQWGIDADNAEIEVLAKRLSQCLGKLRNRSPIREP